MNGDNPYSGRLLWERVENVSGPGEGYRAKVPGGWLFAVMTGSGRGSGVTFIPDPEHKWSLQQ